MHVTNAHAQEKELEVDVTIFVSQVLQVALLKSIIEINSFGNHCIVLKHYSQSNSLASSLYNSLKRQSSQITLPQQTWHLEQILSSHSQNTFSALMSFSQTQHFLWVASFSIAALALAFFTTIFDAENTTVPTKFVFAVAGPSVKRARAHNARVDGNWLRTNPTNPERW